MSREGVLLSVRGRVQGVAFRWFTARQAEELGLAGWVRNRRDGSVEAEAWGERAVVEQFVERLRTGPAAARVREIGVQWLDSGEPPAGFEIRPSD